MVAAPAPSLARHALVPLSLVACFWLVYGIEAPPIYALVVGGAIMVLYLGAPELGLRSLARFDRRAIAALSRGHADALPSLYARALPMRLFAPPALVAERRGMVEAENGEFYRARRHFREALEGYPDGMAPLPVLLGLANACYRVGDDDEAVRRFRQLARLQPDLPGTATHLAHALTRLGRDLDQAEDLLGRIEREAPGPEPRLVRALMAAKKGKRRRATKMVREVEAELDGELDPALERLAEEVRSA